MNGIKITTTGEIGNAGRQVETPTFDFSPRLNIVGRMRSGDGNGKEKK